MRHASKLFAALPVLLLAACDSPATTQALPTTLSRQLENDHFESIIVVHNECNGEVIAGTGNVHVVYAVTADGSGGFHVNYKFQLSNLKLTGATTGASYVFSDEFHFNDNVTAGVEVSNGENANIIGQGQTPNEILHFLLHITVNANGELTSFVDNFTIQCH
jgi:hypothetical protein